MNKTLSQLILSTFVLLCMNGAQAQEIDSLYVDSTDNEFSTVHMLDSVFKHVDLSQVPTGILKEKAFPTIDIGAYDGTIQDSNEVKPVYYKVKASSIYRT